MAEAIYRDYDRAALDAQLNNRARVPDHEAHLARWSRDSAAARQSLACRLALVYGPSGGQTLDLFPATARGAAPLLAFIHGGYWQNLDKGDFSYLAPAFVEAGIAYASLNYDLAPAVSIGEIVAQIRRAVAWLAEGGAGSDVDVERIYLAGHSAGGHLVAMAMLDAWPAAAGLERHPVRGGCSVSGLYELEPLRLSYQQEVLRLDPRQVADLSPQRHAPGPAGPLICAVGAAESREFLDQQADFVAAWGAAGAAVSEVALPGRDHFTAIDALGEPEGPLFRAARDLALG